MPMGGSRVWAGTVHPRLLQQRQVNIELSSF